MSDAATIAGKDQASTGQHNEEQASTGQHNKDQHNVVLRACGVHKEYGEKDALIRAVAGVDLQIYAGETVAIMGPSGCGKSTLLHLLGGLDRPSSGEIFLAGERIDQASEKTLARLRGSSIGFVFQSFYLLDELTAQENIELAPLLAGRTPKVARQRATELLDRIGLADRAKHLPSQLSGGQRQRIAIARALANEPLVVLADEPTGNLDSAATDDVLELFHNLHDTGQTQVIVTHDTRTATAADRVVTMRDGVLTDEAANRGATAPLTSVAGLDD